MREGAHTITIGGDYYKEVNGNVIKTNVTGDNAQLVINAQNIAESITLDSPQEDVAKFLGLVKQELAKLNLPEDVKEEAVHELKGAEIQVKKAEPNKPKIAGKLKAATEALKETGTLSAQAVAVGNMIGKAILWCGAQWTMWKYGM